MYDCEGYVHGAHVPAEARGIGVQGTVLQVVESHLMWVLVIKFWISRRAEHILHGQTIFPA